MEKKFKNIEILSITEALNELIQLKFSTKTSWNIMKNIQKFDSVIKDYWKAEEQLVKEYAIKDSKGNVKFGEDKLPIYPPNNLQKYKEEHKELLECESVLDLLSIKLSSIEGKDIKPATLLLLEFMIEDDSE